jgi:hypothetical protein
VCSSCRLGGPCRVGFSPRIDKIIETKKGPSDGLKLTEPVRIYLFVFLFITKRAKSSAENQYESLRSVISDVIQYQGWKVEQISE